MESEWVAKWKEQHNDIRDELGKLSSYVSGETVSIGDTIDSLKKFKDVLAEHLKSEDENLYPKLLQAKDEKVRETAKQFSDEMLKISKNVFRFFDKYVHLMVSELISDNEFKVGLREIAELVGKRIDIEEVTIYPLNKKLE